MVTGLRKLKNLTLLSIYVGRDQMPVSSADIYAYPQFLSVKYLHFEVFSLSYTLFWRILRLFPNVNILYLKHDFEFTETKHKNMISQMKQEFPKLYKVVSQ